MPLDLSADLVVLGAGPAGLAAAWWAARGRRSVVVLERADRVGGMAGSFEVAGVRVDHGSHRLHPATPPHLLAELRGLLGEDLQTRPRNGRLRVADTWVGFPLRPGELVRALPPRLLARIAADAVTGPLRRPRADTFAEVIRSGLGPALYEAMYAPYAVKLWGLPGDRIAGEQARRRVTADTPGKVAARMLRKRRTAPGGARQGHGFYYPRRGFGQIVEALADAAAAAGADIRLGVAADRLELQDRDVTVGVGAGEVAAGHVFSTIPMPVLGRIARPGPTAEVLRAAGRLRFRAMALVYVVHEGGRYSPFDAHYLPGSGTPVTRISEPANYRVADCDPADRTVLCAEIPCAIGDGIWSAADDELADLVDDALVRTGLPRPRRVGMEVRRLPHVYPVYEVGYARHLAELDAWAAGLRGVTTFGRLVLFAHDNTHHAFAMAHDAVAALGPGGFDPAVWEAARRRFAAHVVED
jgi:protoporphyrinogen oxidase